MSEPGYFDDLDPVQLGVSPSDDMADIEKAYALTFNTPTGKRVLTHLLKVALCERALSFEKSDQMLRHTEGQRSIVRHIEGMVKRGERDL